MKGYPIKDFLEQICKNKCENLLNRNQILKKNRRNNFERQTQKPLLSSTGWWLGEFTARRSMRDNQRNFFLKKNLWNNFFLKSAKQHLKSKTKISFEVKTAICLRHFGSCCSVRKLTFTANLSGSAMQQSERPIKGCWWIDKIWQLYGGVSATGLRP